MLIIITGPSGVGKTTLAKKLSEHFHLPVIHKDELKEILFDTLGSQNREASKELGKASWKLFYHLLETLISKKVSLIVEANFKATFVESIFMDYKKKYGTPMIQVKCTANSDTIVNRFKNRASENRHSGHHDHLISEEALRSGIEQEAIPLKIEGPLIEVDMNDFEKVDYKALFSKIDLPRNNLSTL